MRFSNCPGRPGMRSRPGTNPRRPCIRPRPSSGAAKAAAAKVAAAAAAAAAAGALCARRTWRSPLTGRTRMPRHRLGAVWGRFSARFGCLGSVGFVHASQGPSLFPRDRWRRYKIKYPRACASTRMFQCFGSSAPRSEARPRLPSSSQNNGKLRADHLRFALAWFCVCLNYFAFASMYATASPTVAIFSA